MRIEGRKHDSLCLSLSPGKLLNVGTHLLDEHLLILGNGATDAWAHKERVEARKHGEHVCSGARAAQRLPQRRDDARLHAVYAQVVRV